MRNGEFLDFVKYNQKIQYDMLNTVYSYGPNEENPASQIARMGIEFLKYRFIFGVVDSRFIRFIPGPGVFGRLRIILYYNRYISCIFLIHSKRASQ